MTCASCVASDPSCAFCIGSALCSNDCNSLLNVSSLNPWQCNMPELLNCEAQTECGACLGTSGCVWAVGSSLITSGGNSSNQGDDELGNVCYTGGLFGLSNTVGPGFAFHASAWYYLTCQVTAVTIIIIFCVCLGVLLLLIVLFILICCYLRRKRKNHIAVVDDEAPTNEREPLLIPSSIAPEPTAVAAPAATGRKKSRKKKKVDVSPAVMQQHDVSVNTNRYQQARQQAKRY